MQDAWILKRKLTPPSPPKDWLRRAALTGAEAPVTILSAGPGYGKTLGLLELATAAIARGEPYVWYTADSDDTDVATLFHHLVAGLQAHIPQFGANILALLAADRLDPKRLWQHFLQAIAAYNCPCLLILDDFHHLTETLPEAATALVSQFDKLPPGVRLLLASRKRLAYPLARLEAGGLVSTLDQSLLRFTSDEERAFLASRAPGGQIPEAWLSQGASLDGWPLGWSLATALGTAEAYPAETSKARWTAYITEELYRAQPDDRRAWMLRAAWLGELSVDACRRVFEDAQAGTHLAALEAEHLLVRVGEGYRFPTHLHEYLLAEAARTIPAERQEQWHRRVADFERARGRLEQALPHLMACRAWPEAVDVCEAIFPAMRFCGRQALIARWLEAFPAAVLAEQPTLQLWHGHCLARAGDHVEAQAAYVRAHALYEEVDDDGGAFRALGRQCTVALVQGDEGRIGPLLLQTLARQTAGRAEDLADFMLARAYAAEQRGDLALMLECNQAVLGIPVGDNLDLAASRCIALMNLYTSTLHGGDLESAGRHVLAAAEVASAFGFAPYHLFTFFLQAHLALTRGELEAANQHLRALPDYWPEVLDWHDLGCAYTILAHWHQAREDWKAADEAIRRSRTIFEQADFQQGCKLPLERQLWQAVHRKQYARVASLYAQGGEQPRNIYDLALALPHARALHLAGQPQSAVAILDAVLPALDGLGAQLHVARGTLFAAAARLALGETAAAEHARARAYETIERQGYHFLLEQDRDLLRELGTMTAERVVPAAEPLTAGGALELSVLGSFDVRLAGVLLDHWPRRKAKLVLAALLLYRRGLSVAEIAEIVGHADGRPEALTVYKVALSTLRYTFEPELEKGAPSRYVLHENERYRLDFERVSSCDLLAFEQAAAEGDRLRAEASHEAGAHYERALALYRGPLFDDAFLGKYFDAEREKLRKRALGSSLWLADYRARLGDHTGAEQALVRAAAIAPCEEEAYLSLMRLHKAQGRPERLRQVYWDYRKALKAGLGLAPGEAFEQAHAAIAGG